MSGSLDLRGGPRVLSISHWTGADILGHAGTVLIFLLEKPYDTSHESQSNGELLSKICEISHCALKPALCGFIKNECCSLSLHEAES